MLITDTVVEEYYLGSESIDPRNMIEGIVFPFSRARLVADAPAGAQWMDTTDQWMALQIDHGANVCERHDPISIAVHALKHRPYHLLEFADQRAWT